MSDHPLAIRLGRRYVEDARDWDTDTLHERLGLAPVPLPPSALWADAVVLDQGNFGTCVGNGWAGWGDSAPIIDAYTETDARAIYREATCIDGACDDTYQAGASVRSGAKAMQARNRLSAYAFAPTLDAIREWLANHGPVVMGTDWLEAMFTPDASGLVHATGAVAGGHCYLCIGYDIPSDTFQFRNSWGKGWGVVGNFEMSSADLQTLLNQNGEACAAAELPLIEPTPTPTPSPAPSLFQQIERLFARIWHAIFGGVGA